MARIRTIKPEFWDSPGVETTEPVWRLLYIAMWNWADDHGRGKAEARELMGFAFPRDEDMTVAEFRRGLGEVRRVFGVKFYRVDGRSFYLIPSWDRHQKIDKRSGARWPDIEDGEEYDPATGAPVNAGLEPSPPETRRVSAETPPSIRREEGAGTGEQGNRGTEEEEKNSCSAKPSEADLFDEFWSVYPKRVAKQAARRRWDTLIRRGTNPTEIIAGARTYAQQVHGTDPQFIKQPDGWLNAGRWEDETPPPAPLLAFDPLASARSHR
jgi:hypothetical protein